jgi:hypothetical protein
MKIKELDARLVGKLQLERSPGTRHSQYLLRLGGRNVGLPTIVCIEHGSGDLSNKTVGSIAKALGLNEHSLKQMVGCRIGRACVLLCLCGRLLQFVHQKFEDQGEIFRPGLLAMIESVELLLAEPSVMGRSAWSRDEQKAFERFRSQIDSLRENRDLGSVSQKLGDRMNWR